MGSQLLYFSNVLYTVFVVNYFLNDKENQLKCFLFLKFIKLKIGKEVG